MTAFGTALAGLLIIMALIVYLFRSIQSGGAAKQENKTIKNGLGISRLMKKRNDEIEKETREQLAAMGDGDSSHPDFERMRRAREQWNSHSDR